MGFRHSLTHEESNSKGIGDAGAPIVLPELAQFLQVATGRRGGLRAGASSPIGLS